MQNTIFDLLLHMLKNMVQHDEVWLLPAKPIHEPRREDILNNPLNLDVGHGGDDLLRPFDAFRVRIHGEEADPIDKPLCYEMSGSGCNEMTARRTDVHNGYTALSLA